MDKGDIVNFLAQAIYSFSTKMKVAEHKSERQHTQVQQKQSVLYTSGGEHELMFLSMDLHFPQWDASRSVSWFYDAFFYSIQIFLKLCVDCARDVPWPSTRSPTPLQFVKMRRDGVLLIVAAGRLIRVPVVVVWETSRILLSFLKTYFSAASMFLGAQSPSAKYDIKSSINLRKIGILDTFRGVKATLASRSKVSVDSLISYLLINIANTIRPPRKGQLQVDQLNI